MSGSRKGRPMSGVSKRPSFVASVATQIRTAIQIGAAVDDKHAGVHAWVKYDHLDFTVSYRNVGVRRD